HLARVARRGATRPATAGIRPTGDCRTRRSIRTARAMVADPQAVPLDELLDDGSRVPRGNARCSPDAGDLRPRGDSLEMPAPAQQRRSTAGLHVLRNLFHARSHRIRHRADPLAPGGLLQDARRNLAIMYGPALSRHRMVAIESGCARRTDPVQGRTRPNELGLGAGAADECGAGEQGMRSHAAGSDPAGLDTVRAVADAVLYEGYLLYPYRATSSKTQLRWQCGGRGAQGAEASGIGEDSHLSMQCLLDLGLLESIESAHASLIIHVRFLQLQQRRAERADAGGGYLPVSELRVDSERWFSWDEGVEIESSRTVPLADLRAGR